MPKVTEFDPAGMVTVAGVVSSVVSLEATFTTKAAFVPVLRETVA
jgi:hypothetical protein